MALRCPDRVTTVPELAVNGVLLAGTAIYTGVSSALFLANRNKFPISQRGPILAVLCNVSVLCTIVILDTATMIPRQFHCASTYVALIASLGAAFLGYWIRFASICLEYEIAKRLTEKVEFGENSKPTARLLKIRAFLNSPFKLGLVFIAILFMSFLAPLIAVAANMPSDVYIHELACSKMKVAFGNVILVNCALFIVFSLILAYFLRRVQENFHIMTELRMLIYTACYLLVSVIITSFVEAIARASNCKFRFIMFLVHMFPMILGTSISMVFPLLKMRNREKKSTEASSTQRSSVFKNRQSDLVTILRDPSKAEHFKRFLIKEFASENIVFWTKVENLQKISGDREALLKEINCIYGEFCEINSVCCINISYEVRQTLSNRIKLLEQLNDEDLLSVFQESRKEIEVLMLRDSFARFKLSKEFKSMSSELEKVNPQSIPTVKVQ